MAPSTAVALSIGLIAVCVRGQTIIVVPFTTPTGEEGHLQYEVGADAANARLVAELCDRVQLSDADCLDLAGSVEQSVHGTRPVAPSGRIIEIPFEDQHNGAPGHLRWEVGADVANTALVAELCDHAHLTDADCLATARWVEDYARSALVDWARGRLVEVPFEDRHTGAPGQLLYVVGADDSNAALIVELCNHAELSYEDCLATADWVDEYVRGVLVEFARQGELSDQQAAPTAEA